MPDTRADVSAGATAVLKAIAERLQTTLEALAGPGFDLARAEAEGMSWATFCDLSDALMERAGGAEALAGHGACAITVPELGPSIRILRTVVGCQGLYWANFRWGGPSLFRTVKTTFVVRRDGTYVGTIALPDDARHCEAFFHICAGVFRALPRVLGLDEAQIEVRVAPRYATYVVQPPAIRSWFSQLRWLVTAMMSSSELVDRLAEQNLRLTEEQRVADQARAEAVEARHRAEASLRIAEEARATAEAARALADEALRLRSEFVGTVSHELRTPLNGILGMSQILLDRPLPRDVRDQVTTISTSGRVLLDLINELLDFSKMEAGKLSLDPQPTDLRTVVEQVVTNAAARAGGRPLDVVGHVDPAVADTVLVDGNRLRQVLANLTDNAVKFTQAGYVVLRVVPEGGGLRFSVRDTGIGIAPHDRDRIFQPFVQADGSTTRRFGGTGLGLSIAQALVGLMGGEIGLESTVGQGSTFSFTLPFGGAPARRVAHRGAVRVWADPPVKGAVEDLLRALGFRIDAAADLLVVDLDAALPPRDGPERRVTLSRHPGPTPGTLRKPVTRVDLLAALSALPASTGGDTPAPAAAAHRVHLVDDDPVHAALVGRYLRRQGHTLAAAAEADVVLVCAGDAATLAAGLAHAGTVAPGARPAGVLRPAEAGTVSEAISRACSSAGAATGSAPGLPATTT